mgnify:FL=1
MVKKWKRNLDLRISRNAFCRKFPTVLFKEFLMILQERLKGFFFFLSLKPKWSRFFFEKNKNLTKRLFCSLSLVLLFADMQQIVLQAPFCQCQQMNLPPLSTFDITTRSRIKEVAKLIIFFSLYTKLQN